VTVDIVVLARVAAKKMILLVKRKRPPFEGCWALPGGFVNPHEPLETAARRELQEETGIDAPRIVQVQTVGTPGRDPRGWTISVVYSVVLTQNELVTLLPRAGSDAAEVSWFDLDDLPALAFDHGDILSFAIGRLGPELA
jgi:8-oxo-dGTP diphosphatase